MRLPNNLNVFDDSIQTIVFTEQSKENSGLTEYQLINFNSIHQEIMNALYQRPHSIFNDTDDPVDFISVFPGTFTEKMSEFIEAWQPTMHVHCESSILPFDAINDGLDKFATWPPPEEE